MSSNPIADLLNADLNSKRNRTILRILFGSAGAAFIRYFPTRAASCYSVLITGFALAFVPIAQRLPARLTLAMTLAGAGLVAVAAHELDELQDDIDETKQQKQQERQLRQYAEAEAKSKLTETNLLRHSYDLDKSLPLELQQAIAPAPASDKKNATTEQANDRAAFDAAVSAVQNKQQKKNTTSNSLEQTATEQEQIEQKSAIAFDNSNTENNPTQSFTATMEQIAQRLVSMTVIGVPGAGKAVFVSNLLQLVRRYHPYMHVFVMEGKGDEKEAGYWKDLADDVRSIKGLEEHPVDIVNWINESLDDFKAVDGPKLLIFDEATYLYKVWLKTHKKGFENYVQYKIGLSSMGDSLDNYIWEIGQVSNAKDLGVTAGIRSLFKPIAIVSNHDRGAANALLGTQFVPLPEDGKKAVMQMCDRSSCGRAVYDYVNDCWQAMPRLANLSGFDRDTRTFADQNKEARSESRRRRSHLQQPPKQPKQADINRERLERLLSVEAPEPTREATCYGLTSEQIAEVQKRISRLHPGTISSVKRIRENSRLLREQGITQADLAELFDYLAQTKAVEWIGSDKRDFRYCGGL